MHIITRGCSSLFYYFQSAKWLPCFRLRTIVLHYCEMYCFTKWTLHQSRPVLSSSFMTHDNYICSCQRHLNFMLTHYVFADSFLFQMGLAHARVTISLRPPPPPPPMETSFTLNTIYVYIIHTQVHTQYIH